MKIDAQTDDFQEATHFLTAEARHFVLDALACTFHNQGYTLEGNTAESDVRWLAKLIWQHEGFGRNGNLLDQESVAEQERYDSIARVAITALPTLANRMAARYIAISQALKTTAKIARVQSEQLAAKKRKQKRS